MIKTSKRKLAKYPYGGDIELEELQSKKDVTNATLNSTGKGAIEGASAGSSFGPYGAVVGGIVGGIAGLGTGYNDAIMENARIEQENKQTTIRNNIATNQYFRNKAKPFQGNADTNFYGAYGGDIKAQNGGQLVPLSSDASKAIGATHEQGGIDVSARNNNTAEIEDQEIVQGTRVFSDRLHTTNGNSFAQESENLSKEKANHESLLKSTDNITKGTAQRRISAINTKLDNLYVLQDQTKKSLGLENESGQAKYGGTNPVFKTQDYDNSLSLNDENKAIVNSQNSKGFDYMGAVNKAVPYLDNLYNSNLINQTPKVPTPRLVDPANLVTEYNVNPQLSAVDRETTSANVGIDRSVNSGSTSSAFRSYNLAKAIQAKSDILGNKVNVETGLINNDRMNRQSVQAGNNALLNQTDLLKTQRLAEINSMKSANVANAVDDFKAKNRDQQNYQLDLQRMKLLEKQYRDTGIIPANFADDPNWVSAIAKTEGITEQEVLRKYGNQVANRGIKK